MVSFSGVDRKLIDWGAFAAIHPKVERLNLAGTDISDEDVSLVLGLSELKSLDLSSSRVKGKCLSALSKHLNLTELVLVNIPVYGDDLEHLASEQQLKKLYLSSALVDDQTIARLREIIPWCEIVIR